MEQINKGIKVTQYNLREIKVGDMVGAILNLRRHNKYMMRATIGKVIENQANNKDRDFDLYVKDDVTNSIWPINITADAVWKQ